MKVKYLIIGAGPAGLSFACYLKKKKENSFIVLEKESEAGGLCRSAYPDGFPIDIGGGHFLDTKRKRVLDFLFDYMPVNEWNIYNRKSTISIHNYEIDHPIESHIWQFPDTIKDEYLESVKNAGCINGVTKPEFFVDWIRWKLGDKIADNYMLPYNSKLFGDNLDELGTYWLEKLPNVSYEDILKSCEECATYGSEPAHSTFYYPKNKGYGEVWKRMAQSISQNIMYNAVINEVDIDDHIIRLNDDAIYAEYIINTAPWTSFNLIKGLSNDIFESIKELKYTSVEIKYYSSNFESDAHWIYCPNQDIEYHRILNRKTFVRNASGYWTETNVNRLSDIKSYDVNSWINKYAYPLNTVNKPEIIRNLLKYAEKKKVFGLGRWGEWQHYNSDVVVERAMALCDRLLRDV